MADILFHSEINGIQAICFDTGLNEQDFARAGLSKLLTRQGIIVRNADTIEKTEKWKCKGVVKQNGSMVIWGADFAECPAVIAFDALLADDSQKDSAFDAVRRWLNVHIALKDNLVPLAPGGTFIDGKGNLFFPPESLIERCFEAGNTALEKKERFVHPDLEGKAAAAWTLACMLYRIFCNADAFPAHDIITIHQDMREGVFSPPRFANYGIDWQFDALIKRAFSTYYEDHPSLEAWRRFLEEKDASNNVRNFAAFFHTLTPEESEKMGQEKERFIKKKNFSVKARRFLTRNNAIVLGIAVTVVAMGLIIGSVMYDRSKLPNTKGMTPVEVVQAYYMAFSALDHEFMQSAVLKKAGKADIDVAVQLYALDRVRQAYQMSAVQEHPSIIKAQDWLDDGGQPIGAEYFVFGATDMRITPEDQGENNDEVTFIVRYNLWATNYGDEDIQPGTLLTPTVQTRVDKLRLMFYKGAWRIAEIQRR
jgi:hypothetical protein